jgi:hypothetical protein
MVIRSNQETRHMDHHKCISAFHFQPSCILLFQSSLKGTRCVGKRPISLDIYLQTFPCVDGLVVIVARKEATLIADIDSPGWLVAITTKTHWLALVGVKAFAWLAIVLSLYCQLACAVSAADCFSGVHRAYRVGGTDANRSRKSHLALWEWEASQPISNIRAVKSRKWACKLICHFIDMATTLNKLVPYTSSKWYIDESSSSSRVRGDIVGPLDEAISYLVISSLKKCAKSLEAGAIKVNIMWMHWLRNRRWW